MDPMTSLRAYEPLLCRQLSLSQRRSYAPSVSHLTSDSQCTIRKCILSTSTICRVAVPDKNEEILAPRLGKDLSRNVQKELTNAALFGDYETCIYLLNHTKYHDIIKLDDRALKKLVQRCFSRGLPGRALEVVLNLQPKPSPKHFSILLKECATRGDIKELDRVLEARQGLGYRPDVYTHSARITGLGMAKESIAAMGQLQLALKDPTCQNSIELYNATISACLRSNDLYGAEHVWNLLASSECVMPDIVTFNAMIKVGGATGDFEKVKYYYNEIDRHGLEPTSWTYTAVFSAASSCKVNTADWLIQVYKAMSVQPNDYILSSFFSAMSHSVCSKDHIDVVFDLLEESRREGGLNEITYTSFITFLARQDMPDRALDIWDAARKDEIDVSPHFFSALFSACAKAKGSALESLHNIAFDAFDEFSSWWLDQDPDNIPKHIHNDSLTAYNAFLNFLGESNQFDIALLIFESMKSHGPVPDVVTYNTMLHLLGSSHDVDSALKFYWEMSQAGLEANERTFGSLLHTFASIGDADGAKKIFQSLADSGIAPNSILYTSFINATVKQGSEASLKLSFDLADEMRAANIPLTDVTYGCLLLACEKKGDVSHALDLYQRACIDGVTPSDQMHNILISVCTRCGKLDEALDLVKGMARKHSNIQKHTMNSLTRALSFESPIRAARMLSLMQTMGMQPSRKTKLEVMKQCALAGDVSEALEMYNALCSSQVELDGPSGSALISSLCSAQNLTDAVRVYDSMMAMAWRGLSSSKRGKSLPKRAHEPSGMALASLVQAHAAGGLINQAWKYYVQLRRKSKSLEEATLTNRRMFEALIEGQCRVKNLKKALTVFDDWKAASTAATVRSNKYPPRLLQEIPAKKQQSPAIKARKQPKLSYLALAYLEASCNSDPEHSWRVYDILAVMRSQKEFKRQSELARPSKRSHHVFQDE